MNYRVFLTILILAALSAKCFGQPVRISPIPKNWYQLDPATDSVAGISLFKAYRLLRNMQSTTVIVAVIDNGVDIDHEDLKNVIWNNQREIPDNGIDDDHNGYADDVHGWNFRGAKDGTIIENEQAGATQFYKAWNGKFKRADSSNLSAADQKMYAVYKRAEKVYLEHLTSKDSNEIKYAYNLNFSSGGLIADYNFNSSNTHYGSPYFKLSPNLSHGTHVAGIIAAQRNNGIGIDGIADNVKIMPIVASMAVGDERDEDVANAIRYAVDNGARIISMSFSKLFSADKKLVDDAIRYAEKKMYLLFTVLVTTAWISTIRRTIITLLRYIWMASAPPTLLRLAGTGHCLTTGWRILILITEK